MKNEPGIWEIAVLALLREAPMHPYQMRRLLQRRHKDEILALKRGSLYHAIGRLERDGLINAKSTERDGRRPERTTYCITPEGKKSFTAILRKLIATPRREPSEFMAAMSFLVHLTPAEATPRLEDRMRTLEATIAQIESDLAAAQPFVDRINLIESEYLLAMQRADLDWTRNLAEQIRTRELDWDLKTILENARSERDAADRTEE